MYQKYIKRGLDIVISFVLLIALSPVFLIVAIIVYWDVGHPVIFCQRRPGKDEKIFRMYKFRTMKDLKHASGKNLPDEKRLTKTGKRLRSTSLDELPELLNVLKGEMSLVGPRPQLIKDMVFMTKEQRKRHEATPGLTGLAQVNGRNNVPWEEKLELDLIYLQNITFTGDLKILGKTLSKVIKREDVNTEGMETAQDLGEYLLSAGKISQEEYAGRLQEYENKYQAV